jgi:L-iditol 2-dehydrogenase
MPEMIVPVLYRPGRFHLESVKRPEPAALESGEVLVRVLAGGICGSDGPYFKGAPTPSFARVSGPPAGYPMHEIAGQVVAVGPSSSSAALDGGAGLQVGDRVVGWATRFDGLADYVITSAGSLARHDDGLSPEQAVLIQPLACVLYAVERLGPVAGLYCAVLGLGPIGLMFCHILKQRGAQVVVGVDRVDRSARVADFRIDQFVWATSDEWSTSIAYDDRPNVVVEAIGHQVSTLGHALAAVADSGRVFYFGVNDDDVYPLDMTTMLRKNLTLMSGGTRDRVRMLREANEYLAMFPELLPATITHTFRRADVQEAYSVALTPSAGRLKVVVRVTDVDDVDS